MGISADIYTNDKATFRERVAKLAGGTTYREPMGGRSTDPNKMTDLDVAAALAYARDGADDIGPDIAYCIVCGSDWHRARIVKALATALLHGGGRALRHGRPHLLTIADNAFQTVVWQRRVARPIDCPPKSYGELLLAGAITLQSKADEAIYRAERAFRSRAA